MKLYFQCNTEIQEVEKVTKQFLVVFLNCLPGMQSLLEGCHCHERAAAFFSEAQIVFFDLSPYIFSELTVGDTVSNKLVKKDKQSQKPVNITLLAGGTIINFLVKGEMGCFHCMNVHSDLV